MLLHRIAVWPVIDCGFRHYHPLQKLKQGRNPRKPLNPLLAIHGVKLLDDETVKELNKVILQFSHDVYKKKRGGSIGIKN